MSDRSKYHLKETYRNTEVLLKSIIGAFFAFKFLLTLKNLFRLINEPADTMLALQISAVKSSRDDFKRHRES